MRIVLTTGLISLILIGIVLYVAISPKPQSEAKTPIEIGRNLVEEESSCRSCHQKNSGYRAPKLEHLLGKQRRLTSGETIVIDEIYLRRSLTHPKDQVAMGYQATMPSFSSIYDDAKIDAIVAYLSTL